MNKLARSMFPLLLLSSCRGLLGIDDLTTMGSEAGAPSTSTGGIDGAGGQVEIGGSRAPAASGGERAVGGSGATEPVCGARLGNKAGDRAWAQWPIAKDSPPDAAYLIDNDTVVDGLTCLMWQRWPTIDRPDYDYAKRYCEDLDLGGYDDWRVPTRIELVSIVDFGRFNPAINPVAFPDVRPEPYWTTTPWFDSVDARSLVTFADGSIARRSTDGGASVLCVRGGA